MSYIVIILFKFATIIIIKMSKHYLFFCSHGYAIPILRPLQDEILQRGDEVAWFLEPGCPDGQLNGQDLRLKSKKEVKASMAKVELKQQMALRA